MMGTSITRIAIAVAAALLAGAAAQAQEQKPIELRYTTASPPKSVWAMQVERWAKAIDQESRGEMKAEVFLASQLGAPRDTVQQVARGRIDMGGFNMSDAALLVPELQLLILPLYFRSHAELDCVLDTGVAKTAAELMAKKGVQFLGWGDAGMVDVVGKRAFVSPADVNGVKVGTYGTRMGALLWEGLGGNPTPTSVTEIASAFQTGLIDLSPTVAAYYVPSGLGKIAPVLTRVDLIALPTLNMMNKAKYDSLSPQQQQALERARNVVPIDQTRKEVRDFEASMRAQHEKNGGQVVQTTTEQREAWRKAVAPLYPRMIKEAGPDAEQFFQVMEAGRKACEKRG